MRREIFIAILVAVPVAGFVPRPAAIAGDDPTTPAALLAGRLDAGQVRHLESLMKPFQDPDADKRRAAVLAVGRVGDVAVPYVKKRLDDSNSLVQRSSLLALGEIGGEAALVTLEAALAGSGSKLRDEEAAAAYLVLGRLGEHGLLATSKNVDAIALLAGAASSKKPSLGRRAAVLALGRAGATKELLGVLETLPREPLEDQRVAMLVSIATAGDPAATEFALSALTDRTETVRVRQAACLVIAESGDSRACDALRKSIASERDERVLVAAALALGALADPASRSTLVECTDKTGALRNAAYAALAARNDSADFIGSFLSKWEKCKDTELLARVTLAAAASRSSKLDQPLIALLAHPRPEVRSAAGLALASRGTQSAEPAIVSWLTTEKDTTARGAALLVTGALALHSAKDTLSQIDKTSAHGALAEQVLRTIDGRRDPRLLQDEVEKRLREKHAREWDLRCVEYSDLVAVIFHFDLLARARVVSGKNPPAGGDGSAGSGDGSGGSDGSGGGDDGSGEGGSSGTSGAGSPYLKPKIDRKPSVLERDLELWFTAEPYFVARSSIR